MCKNQCSGGCTDCGDKTQAPPVPKIQQIQTYSILSDNEIVHLCVPPTHVYDHELYMEALRAAQSDPVPLSPTNEGMEAHFARLRQMAVRPVKPEEADAFVPMIAPFLNRSVRSESIDVGEDSVSRRVLSYGVSSYGYDVRLAEKFVIFSNINSVIVDPKKPDERSLVELPVHADDDGAKYVIMPPNSYGMGHTVEYFRMPRNVTGVCVGKSTYARSCVHVNVTPIEAGFEGQVVIEMSNSSGLPVKIYLNEGIAQVMFHRGNPCHTSYADRGGKYQGQEGLTLACV